MRSVSLANSVVAVAVLTRLSCGIKLDIVHIYIYYICVCVYVHIYIYIPARGRVLRTFFSANLSIYLRSVFLYTWYTACVVSMYIVTIVCIYR